MEIVLLLLGALVLGVIAQRLKQSPILGYLLAGILAGPFIFNDQTLFQLAEIGVSLLLFSIGLEFSFSRLREMGAVALGGGTIQVTATLSCFAAGFSFFHPLGESVTLGAIIALSSTAIVMRVLVDRSELDSPRGRNALGILLLQDIAVVPLVMMVTMIGQSETGHSIWMPMVRIIIGALGLMIVFYVLFYRTVPFLLKTRTMHISRDLIILMAIVISLGSIWMAHAVGLSPSLGAFLAGMLLAESPFASQIRSDIGSLRTLFVTLFFTTIGMLADPRWMLSHLQWILGGLVVMTAGKTLIIFTIIRMFRHASLHALATGITLAQIGEFSFVLAATASTLNLIGEDTFNWIVSVTIFSMFLSPFLVSYANAISRWMLGLFVSGSTARADAHDQPDASATRNIFIVGFGPAGQQVADGLLENGITPFIIEMRPASAQKARAKGLQVFMGDAIHEEVLRHAGIVKACLVVVTIPDPRNATATIESIRRLSPESTVIARSRYHIHNRKLEAAGAHMIVDEENMVGQGLAEALTRCLKGESAVDLHCACALAGLPADKDD